MEKLGLGDLVLDADKQSVLDSALLAVFDIDDVHAQIVEPDPERDWNVGLQVIKVLVDAGTSKRLPNLYTTYSVAFRSTTAGVINRARGVLVSKGSERKHTQLA
jgi:hypothetical protein